MQVQIYLTTNSLSRDIGVFTNTGLEGHTLHLLFYLQVFFNNESECCVQTLVVLRLFCDCCCTIELLLRSLSWQNSLIFTEEDFSLSRSAV